MASDQLGTAEMIAMVVTLACLFMVAGFFGGICGHIGSAFVGWVAKLVKKMYADKPQE